MSRSQRRLLLSILNIAGYLSAIIVNVLANTIPIGGNTTGQISDKYPNLFVPAGLTFSIWGLIYLLLAIFVIYGIASVSSQSEKDGMFIDRIGILFIITCMANTGWILSWHYQKLILSLGCMAALIVALIGIYARLNVGRSNARPTEKYLVHLSASVYIGWITIAAIANVNVVLVAYRWNRFGISEQLWTIAIVAIGIVLGLAMLFSRKDIFYALVVDWAVLGILIKRVGDSSNPAPWVVVTTIIGICLLTTGVITQVIRRRVY